MFTRIILLTLIAALAAPVAALPGAGGTFPSRWSDVSVAAKGKKNNAGQKNKRRQNKTVTRTVRQPVTQTFRSDEPITIPDSVGQATPYPAAMEVSGFVNGTITDVNLILNDLTHASPNDVDVLLCAGDGRRALVMSDAGGYGTTDADLTLDDEAAAPIPETDVLQSGAYRPVNYNLRPDNFAAPAPAPNGAVALSPFDGADPNGTWRLWVMDQASGGAGDIGAGWALQITAEVDPGQVQERVKAKKDRKGS